MPSRVAILRYFSPDCLCAILPITFTSLGKSRHVAPVKIIDKAARSIQAAAKQYGEGRAVDLSLVKDLSRCESTVAHMHEIEQMTDGEVAVASQASEELASSDEVQPTSSRIS